MRVIGFLFSYLGSDVPGGILAASSGLNLPSRSMSAASLFARSSLSFTGSLITVEPARPCPGEGEGGGRGWVILDPLVGGAGIVEPV